MLAGRGWVMRSVLSRIEVLEELFRPRLCTCPEIVFAPPQAVHTDATDEEALASVSCPIHPRPTGVLVQMQVGDMEL